MMGYYALTVTVWMVRGGSQFDSILGLSQCSSWGLLFDLAYILFSIFVSLNLSKKMNITSEN